MFLFYAHASHRYLHSFPTRRSSDLTTYHFRISATNAGGTSKGSDEMLNTLPNSPTVVTKAASEVTQSSATLNASVRSEEHTSELQSRGHLVCRLLLEKKKKNRKR